MKDDLQKSDSCGLKSERKKILTSSTCSLACLSTNLGAFCPMVVHLPSEKSILPYFSGPRGVAILDCDSHSQAGSTTPPPQTLGHQQPKKNFWCLFCILGYSKHIIFSWKSPIFWLKRVGTGAPPPPLIWILSQVYPKFDRLFLAHFLGGPINYWIDEILPPHLCTMCFITFMDSSKAN